MQLNEALALSNLIETLRMFVNLQNITANDLGLE